MEQQLEDSSNYGEGNDVENSDFYKWMMSVEVKHGLIVKLIANGIDSMDMLQEIANDENLLNETNLKMLERAKVRTILKKIPNHHIIIDKEESESIIQMEKKLKSLQTAIVLVADTTKAIDEQVMDHTKKIKSTFKYIHHLLNERENTLIQQLNEIANKKKSKLQEISKSLEEKKSLSQKHIKATHHLLKKSIEISQLESRKKEILNTAKNMDNIVIVTDDHPVIADKNISVLLDSTQMEQRINAFGVIFSEYFTPVLNALKDNKNSTIAVKWTLNKNNDEKENEDNQKLKVEWSDSKDKNNDMTQEWKYSKVFKLSKNENTSSVNIKVDNKETVFWFRIKYFDGKRWSIYSNIKSIAHHIKIFKDEWDTNVGANINVNTARDTITKIIIPGYESAYMTNVVSSGVHEWKIKLNKVSNNWNLFGIWKISSGKTIVNKYFTSKAHNGYAYVLNRGCLTDPSNPGSAGSSFGVNCKTGDSVTMILNFDTLSLSYKVNDIDLGKAFDIERTAYRAAISFYGKQDSCTLISYHKE